jgi:hypothetical protein
MEQAYFHESRLLPIGFWPQVKMTCWVGGARFVPDSAALWREMFLSTVLSTDEKFSTCFERKWDHALFSIHLALSTSDLVRIKWENQSGVGVNEMLYHWANRPIRREWWVMSEWWSVTRSISVPWNAQQQAIIVNKIIKAGFSVGWVSALDGNGRTVWIVDAHRDGKRFLVRADEKLTAFVELERAIYEFAVDLIA